MAGRVDRGGILALLDLIEEHRDALAYDWRTRFHMPLDAVPEEMGWPEALGHIRILRADPSTQLAASIEGWDYPLERLGWMFADLIDVQGSSKAGKKWKSYPRPLRAPDKTQRWGDTGGRSRAEVVALLNSMGHSLS